MQQKTIKKPVPCSGIGLHSGNRVSITLRPAPVDSGIKFALKGQGATRVLGLRPDSVSSTGLATTIGKGAESVSTVEHLLAAATGMEIDNLLVEVHGNEVPILDGSAAPFVELFRLAGIREQSKSRRVLAISRDVAFEQDGKYVKAHPCEGLVVDFTIDFKHPLVGRQRFRYVQSPDAFARHLAAARTFGFLAEVEMLRERGLARGGSLENAVVLDQSGVVNPEGLRFEDEFVRHKILDFLGDMAVFGDAVHGYFEVFASGHGLNNAFWRYLGEHRKEFLVPVVVPVAEPVMAPALVSASRDVDLAVIATA